MIGLVFSSIFSNAQTQSSCVVPLNLFNAYQNEAYYIALERLYQTHHSDTAFIQMPLIHRDSILEAMAAVFNLDTQLSADTVFAYHCIHDIRRYFNAHLILEIDTSVAWTLSWWNLITPTGIASLDSLTSTYGYSPLDTLTIGSTHWVVLGTAQQLNIYAFRNLLNSYNGVLNAGSNVMLWDGNRILYSTNGTDRLLKFVLGYNDCPSGCISHHYFNYKVSSSCQVTYTPISPNSWVFYPWPQNCGLSPSNPTDFYQIKENTKVTIYPNPSSDFIHITGLEEGKYEWNILNEMGEIIKNGIAQFSLPDQIIDISNLNDGLYVLAINGQHRMFTKW